MDRGELWWAQLDERRPVVVLSADRRPEVHVVQIVAPATSAEKHGYLLMSGAQALDADTRRRIIREAGPVGAVGIEVWLGSPEGLTQEGVVRVALPQPGRIFCTWATSLDEALLIEPIGVCSPEKLRELDAALQLAEA